MHFEVNGAASERSIRWTSTTRPTACVDKCESNSCRLFCIPFCLGFGHLPFACSTLDGFLSRVRSINRQSSSFLFISWRRLTHVGVDVAYLRLDTRSSQRSDPFLSSFLFLCIAHLFSDSVHKHYTGRERLMFPLFGPAGRSAFGLYLVLVYTVQCAHKMVLLNDCTDFLAFDKNQHQLQLQHVCVKCQRRCMRLQKSAINVPSVSRRLLE